MSAFLLASFDWSTALTLTAALASVPRQPGPDRGAFLSFQADRLTAG
jgi:hypothetical protein